MANVDERLKQAVAEIAGMPVEKVQSLHSFVDDLGLDSLDRVEVVMKIEEEFGIEVSDDDAERLQTVADAVRYVEKALA